MRLFEITNGYQGYAPVRVLVVAENEERALQLANREYRRVADNSSVYDDRYYSDLHAEQLCEDTAAEWIGEVNNG